MSDQKYKQGNFCWNELGTTNPSAAKDFYGKILGWDFADVPMPDGRTYHMVKMANKDAAGIYDLTAKPETKNIPPHWMPYIWVDDIAATTAKVKGLGGQVMMGPTEIPEMGTFSVIQDPQGAVISLWTGPRNVGPEHDLLKAGVPSWFELMTTDIKGAKKFYAELIGWQMKTQQMGTPEQPLQYTLFGDGGEKSDGGMMQMPPGMENVPSNWMVYMTVDNYNASAKAVSANGGKIVSPVMDVPSVGRFSAVQDPQGAVFSIIQYHPQPQ